MDRFGSLTVPWCKFERDWAFGVAAQAAWRRSGVAAQRRNGAKGGSQSRSRRQAYRRKTATAFWPPNPKPFAIATPTGIWRATFGT
jgi:hypothetical protein